MAPARTGLRYVQQEVAVAAGLCPRARLLLVGSRATESAFKKSAGAHDVLHLATHGFFNKFNPLLSRLELEPGGCRRPVGIRWRRNCTPQDRSHEPFLR